MKKIFYISFLALLGIFFVQCDKEQDDLVTENAKEGGLIDVNKTAVNYVIGSGASYDFSIYMHQNDDVKFSEVRIYKYFSAVPVPWSDPTDTTHTTPDSIPAKESDAILQEVLTISDATSHWETITALDYAGLIAGLSIDELPLPSSDVGLNIGDAFNFYIEAYLTNGEVVTQAYEVGMKVSTRYAGTYKFLEGVYYRVGVLSSAGDYWEDEYVIESVDAITYKMNGMCAWMDQTLFFQVNPATLAITYPAEWPAGTAQILNDQPVINCVDNVNDLPNVHCDASNFIVNDDVEGKDLLYMTFGYYTAGSGPREFYQVMEKVVD